MEWTGAMQEDEAVKKWFLPAKVHEIYMKSRFAGATDYDYLARESQWFFTGQADALCFPLSVDIPCWTHSTWMQIKYIFNIKINLFKQF